MSASYHGSLGRADGPGAGLGGGFSLALAPAYPSIEDELRKDVAILAGSLAVRDDYIARLREARDTLAKELRVQELVLESQEHRIRSYQEVFDKRQKDKESGEISD